MSNGGKRPGAGRKKGSKSKKTLEKEAVLAEFRQKILKNADVLFNSQMHIATGQTYLYKIHTNKRGDKGKPELIEDIATIEQYLAGELENEQDDYYFLTTKDPDNRAIDSMLDRTFGKSAQPLTGDKDNPIIFQQITGMKVIKDGA